jgi:thioredoxin 1
MALCCIGGVCIPYTAIVPFMILGLKWIFEKLAAAGLIPAAIQERANSFLSNGGNKSTCCSSATPNTCNNGSSSTTKLRRGKKTSSTLSSSSSSSSSCCDAAAPNGVIFVKTIDEWNSIVNNNNTTVICKMTASWCGPCKAIQPVFEELANNQNKTAKVLFCVVDVDELDTFAAQHRVAMLPTFLVLKREGGEVVDRYSGSSEQKLRDLVSAAAAAATTK